MSRNKHAYILFFGDLIIFLLSLYFTLLVRYFVFPSKETILLHLLPFSILMLAWCMVFLIVGLYERHVLILKRNLPEIIINTQVFNCVLAAVFFYFIPYFSVSPKAVLFIYLAVSLLFILIWRLYVFDKLNSRFVQKAVIIGEGPEVEEMIYAFSSGNYQGISVVDHVKLSETSSIDMRINKDTEIIIADFSKEEVRDISPKMYEMLFSGAEFIKLHDLYESMFGRVAMSLIGHDWFVENVSSAQKAVYGLLKRIIDVVAALLISPIFFLTFPFIAIAIKIEDGGKIFLAQDRVGKSGKIFKLYKFRSMSVDDNGVWIEEGDNRHTKVGKFIRKTRLDEFPQLWNVFRGDVSMIGPRPDMKRLWEELSVEIPYYKIRNIVKPGLSGWAQITQELPPQNLDDTRMRLAYDLYYIKHRSIILDIKIAIRTIKTLLSRSGA